MKCTIRSNKEIQARYDNLLDFLSIKDLILAGRSLEIINARLYELRWMLGIDQ
ncbi:MAG TPA: hypothetical protein VEP90_22910 [Methylomirabilota bacterium]|nr:hypothetical protein [Methylomirabilota bacterium]